MLGAASVGLSPFSPVFALSPRLGPVALSCASLPCLSPFGAWRSRLRPLASRATLVLFFLASLAVVFPVTLLRGVFFRPSFLPCLLAASALLSCGPLMDCRGVVPLAPLSSRVPLSAPLLPLRAPRPPPLCLFPSSLRPRSLFSLFPLLVLVPRKKNEKIGKNTPSYPFFVVLYSAPFRSVGLSPFGVPSRSLFSSGGLCASFTSLPSIICLAFLHITKKRKKCGNFPLVYGHIVPYTNTFFSRLSLPRFDPIQPLSEPFPQGLPGTGSFPLYYVSPIPKLAYFSQFAQPFKILGFYPYTAVNWFTTS